MRGVRGIVFGANVEANLFGASVEANLFGANVEANLFGANVEANRVEGSGLHMRVGSRVRRRPVKLSVEAGRAARSATSTPRRRGEHDER